MRRRNKDQPPADAPEPQGNDATDGPDVEPETNPAPFGWDVIGADGRRIDRWQNEADANALRARVAAASGEEATVEPSGSRLLGNEPAA